MKFFSEGQEKFISLRWFKVIPGNFAHVFCRPGGHSHLCPTTDLQHTAKVNTKGSRNTAEPDPPASTNTHSENSHSHASAPGIVQGKNTSWLLPFPLGSRGSALKSLLGWNSCIQLKRTPAVLCTWVKMSLDCINIVPWTPDFGAGYNSGKKYLHLTSFILLFYTISTPHLNRFPLFSYPPSKKGFTKDSNFKRKLKLEKKFSNSNPVQQLGMSQVFVTASDSTRNQCWTVQRKFKNGLKTSVPPSLC